MSLLEKKGKFQFEELAEESAKRKKRLENRSDDPSDLTSLELSFPTSYQSLADDIKAIRRMRLVDIQSKFEHGKKIYFDPGSRLISTKSLRTNQSTAGKLAISWILGGIIFGEKLNQNIQNEYVIHDENLNLIGWDEKNNHSPSDQCSGSPENILKKLGTWDNNAGIKELGKTRDTDILGENLKKWWSLMTRRIAIDSGTTLDSLAENVISKARYRRNTSILSSLEVCINSLSIFQTLGNLDVDARTLMLGGFQEEGSEALCGTYTEKFIEANNLKMGVCIVGATLVDLGARQFGSDHYRDGQLKRKLLERSTIKIVAADSSKFCKESMQNHYGFCSIDTRCVDLIVTDSFLEILKNIHPEKSQEYDTLEPAEILVEIKNIMPYGVPIIEAGQQLLEFANSSLKS